MKKKIMLLVCAILFSTCIYAVLQSIPKDLDTVSMGFTKRDFAMGTAVNIDLYGTVANQQVADNIIEEIRYLDESVISWRSESSELYTINNNYSVNEDMHISDELYCILDTSLNICHDTGGALDITLRPLLNLWNIEGATTKDFAVPSESNIDDILEDIGYEKISLSTSLRLCDDNLILDLGATGKGYALDCVIDILESENASGAVISVGGSILVYGSKNDRSDWKVGIRNPSGDANDMIGYVSFPAGTTMCVSTSGDYEKFFEIDGVRYHHIFDRVTGYPADSGLSSVTIVCENGAVSDGLSTACFVLGYEASLPILEKYNAEAVFIDKECNIIVTDGLKDNYIDNK